MIWSDTCKECEGSDIKCFNKDCPSGLNRLGWCRKVCEDRKFCPHCKGSGGFNLVAECENCGGKGEYDSDGYGNIINCEDCAFAGYTVLTVEEVEELKGKLPSIFESLIKGDVIQFVYKGQLVKLMPTWRINEPSDSNNSTLT